MSKVFELKNIFEIFAKAEAIASAFPVAELFESCKANLFEDGPRTGYLFEVQGIQFKAEIQGGYRTVSTRNPKTLRVSGSCSVIDTQGRDWPWEIPGDEYREVLPVHFKYLPLPEGDSKIFAELFREEAKNRGAELYKWEGFPRCISVLVSLPKGGYKMFRADTGAFQESGSGSFTGHAEMPKEISWEEWEKKQQ